MGTSSRAAAARGRQGQAAKASLLERLAGKRPQRDTFEVVLDEAPILEVAKATNELGLARMIGRPAEEVAELEATLRAAEEARDEADARILLHLHGLARPAYEALILEHPPTAEEKERGEGYSAESFAPALVALCVVDPDAEVRPLTAEDVRELAELVGDDARAYLAATGRPLLPEDVRELWEEWNQGEVGSLFHKAVQVSTQPRNPALPFG